MRAPRAPASMGWRFPKEGRKKEAIDETAANYLDSRYVYVYCTMVRK